MSDCSIIDGLHSNLKIILGLYEFICDFRFVLAPLCSVLRFFGGVSLILRNDACFSIQSFYFLFLLAWWCNMHIRKLPRFFGCIDLKIGKIFWVVSNSNEILWKAFKWRYIVIFVCWKVYLQCTYICFKLVKIYVEEIINEMLLRR